MQNKKQKKEKEKEGFFKSLSEAEIRELGSKVLLALKPQWIFPIEGVVHDYLRDGFYVVKARFSKTGKDIKIKLNMENLKK